MNICPFNTASQCYVQKYIALFVWTDKNSDKAKHGHNHADSLLKDIDMEVKSDFGISKEVSVKVI